MLLLRRRRKTDAERIQAALSKGLDRELARRLSSIRRRRGSLGELSFMGQEAIALTVLRAQVHAINVNSPDGLRALQGLLPIANQHEDPSPKWGDRVVVPTDILFGLHHRLFPAERMAVVAGRPNEDGLMLTSTFDVTNEQASHVAYTRASPAKLGSALMSMERSGTRLAAWAHSHPGTGPQASYPSATDRRQYSEWILNYPKLVAFIMTEDGLVRFWGKALEDGAVSVEATGVGLERIEHDLYRINR